MIIDLLAAVRNNTVRSFVQFSQIPLGTGRVTVPKDLHILIPESINPLGVANRK